MFKFEPDKPVSIQGETVKFATQEELVVYLLSRLDNLTSELGEFQRSSRELENELEYQVNELESKNRESLIKIDTLQDESNQWKTRYTTYLNETQHKLNEYQQQIGELTAMNDRLSSYIRELEQNNDDLERARRALAASLEDFEGQLNQQIERNVLLENEVSEKEELECVVQRLKEEARDLRHELVVNKNSSEQSARRKQLMLENSVSSVQKDTSLVQSPIINTSLTADDDSIQEISDKLDETNLSDVGTKKTLDNLNSVSKRKKEEESVKVDSTTSPMTPETTSRFPFSTPLSDNKSSSSSLSKSTESRSQQTSTPSSPTLPSFVMTPSSRISALNIVSDLLRKVGALESRLVSAKKATE